LAQFFRACSSFIYRLLAQNCASGSAILSRGGAVTVSAIAVSQLRRTPYESGLRAALTVVPPTTSAALPSMANV
jgi:hypothetical protein